MDIVLIILAIFGFVSGATGVALALYTQAVTNLRVEAAKQEALASLVGTEERITRSIERRMNEQLIAMRQNVQSDAFDMLQATLEKQQDARGGDIQLGNFGNW